MRILKLTIVGLIALATVQLCGAQTLFTDVMARYNWSNKDRYMYTVWVKLDLNDSSKQLIVQSKERPLDVKYDDVKKVILDQQWNFVYLEYRKADGSTNPYILWVDPKIWDKVIERIKGAFGERVSLFSPLVGTKIDKDTLKKDPSSYSVKVDKQNRPMGEIKPGKALIVLVCLPFHYRATGQGKEFKLRANDEVVVAYKMGTYGFAYLDPGEYEFMSVADHASTLKLKVEAGKDYYLLQDTKVGFRTYTPELSVRPKELVLYELNGTFYADWKKKK